MASSHTFFDHTGDFGVDLTGDDLEELCEGLAAAFLDLLTGAPESVRALEARELEASGLDAVDLLVALGNELVFAFEMGFLARELSVVSLEDEDEDQGLRLVATLRGEPYDPERHPIARPMKAVTHHEAFVDEGEAGATARLVFDL